MSTENTTAVVAVVIAVIAFVVTTAQLLQALFGTAEGYRRCQSSVIGDWALRTRRIFRWSEFRFETVFSTPDIRLQRRPLEETSAVLVTGSLKSRSDTLTSTPSVLPVGGLGDLVSWLQLLNRLHVLQHTQSSFFGIKPVPKLALEGNYPKVPKTQES